jgi:hypothetical protein
LLRKHVPVSAEDHAAHDTIGAVMNDAAFEDPYLKASLSVWPQDDIDDIESEAKKELSSGYHYRAEMTPGNFRGMRYDGVMRDIVGNHVALVKDGRAGPDVVVGDSMESLMAKPTRFAALTLGLVAANVAPLIAKDSKIELPKGLFSSITTKNFQTKRTELLGGVRAALDGKLRKGLALDASMEQVGKVMDNVAGLFGEKGGDESVSEEQHNAMEAAAHGESNLGIPKSVGEEFEKADKGKSFDAEPLKNFLREKGMGEDDIKAAFDMLPKPGTDASEEEQAEKTEEEKKAAVSEAVEKERKAMDEKLKGMVTKTAMDEAIKAAAKTTRETERGIRAALDFVRPYVGELASSLALDSADDVYRHAAVAMKIDGAKDIHPSALPTLIKMLPKPGARQTEHTSIAQDEATVTDFEKRFPNATRIQPGA